MPDVGDWAPVSLTVDGADLTTAVTATVRLLPDGVPAAVSLTRTVSTWAGEFQVTAVGGWRVSWTITGTGRGVHHDTVYALGGPDPPDGESYADLADLALWLDADPPTGAARLLVRASRKIDAYLVGAWYPVDDDDGLPTLAEHIAALRDATCAQVEYWQETGMSTGVETGDAWGSVSVGNVSMSRTGRSGASTGSSAVSIPPAVDEILRLAKLLPIAPLVYG